MSESTPPSPPPGATPPADEPVRVAHNPAIARVPERLARGATATDFLAFFGPHEFVIDFLQLLSKPHLVARVVMAPAVVEQFIHVLKENLSRFTTQFGPPPAMPKPVQNPDAKPKPPQEIYDELKISDDILSGVYANTVLVGHTPAEFGIDFITSFIPHAAVSARVYIAAPRMPRLIETLSGLIAQYKRQQTPPPAPGTAPHPGPTGGPFGVPGFPGFPNFPSN